MGAPAMLPLFWLSVGAYAAGAAGVFVPSPRGARLVSAAGSLVGSAAAFCLACLVVFGAGPLEVGLPGLLSPLGGLRFALDRLGAWFLAIVGGVGAAVSVYGAGYTAAYDGRRSQRWLALQSNLFLLSMSLVVSAASAFTFVLAWELMALSSYFLVVAEHDRPGIQGAGLWYLGMTHFGLLALLAAFFLLGGAGAATFAELRQAAPLLSPATRNAVFVLALAGFGSKAGMVPLHVWLPRAHPAAPSHVSALMSAVMVKLGVYGILRVCLDLMGGGPSWWGGALVAVGAATALAGVLYALVDDDLKRLLAYSTVENVGLILLGVGAGFLFLGLAQPQAAALSFAAALLHAANHAAFKGALFLGAGSVIHATGQRDMNRLGGLVKRMPWTSGAFLVGALSMAALPPFNGFVSEWLLFQSFLPGIAGTRASIAIMLTLGIGTLALTGGLAAAASVKAFGISFLAIPRSADAEHAHEAGWAMRAGMALLALACPALALLTVPLLSTISGVLAGLAGMPPAGLTFPLGFTVQTPGNLARVSPVAIMAVSAGVLAAVWIGVRLLSRRAVRVSDTWGCGRIGQTPRMQYTSTAFAEPLRRIFGDLYRPTDDVEVVVHPEAPYHIRAVSFSTALHPWFDRVLYDPAIRAARAAAEGARALQTGSINAYLAYVVMVLVALLALVIGF